MASIPNSPIQPLHKKRYEDNKNMDFYNSSAWRKLRKNYINRHPMCEVMSAHRLIQEADHVDHIIPIEVGGARLDERNLMALCKSIHSVKTSAERSGKLVFEQQVGIGGMIPADRDTVVGQIENLYWGVGGIGS